MSSTHNLTRDNCIALDDLELVGKAFDLVEDDELYSLVSEMLERFAPEVARADLIRIHTPAKPEFADPEDGNDLLDAIERLRQRQAARLLRDSVGSENDG